MAVTRRRLTRPVAPVALLALVAACSSPLAPSAQPTTRATVSPTAQAPRPLTLEDLAPGLQRAQRRFRQPAAQVATPGPAVKVSVGAKPSQNRFDHANVGLSFEATDLADRRWKATAGALDELVGALDRPSLRFGGNSVDRRVWWTASNEPAPPWAEVTLRPADFQRLAAFVKKTKSTVTLVTDLGHEDPKRAASMVFHAHRALGDRLVAVSIGNEPNGYALASQPQYRMRPDTWNPAAFIAQAREYEKAIHAQVPGVRLVGPGTFDAAWLRAFAEARLPGTVAFSQHWYPLWSCDAKKEPNAFPTVENLTSPWLHDRAGFILGMGLSTAARHGLPLWLEETGPTSCVGGNATSRTHAQALWTSDFTLHAAAMGIRRINHHGMIDSCEGGAPMSPLCDTEAFGTRAPHLRGQSNYLALLQLARLRTGTFLPVTVARKDRVYAYAIADGRGIDVVVVNLNDPQAVGASPLQLTLPPGYRSTHASVLHADSLGARNGSKLVPWSPTDVLPKTVNAGSVLAVRLTKG